MELAIEIIIILLLIGGFFCINSLGENQKYINCNKGYKNIIAFVLGFVSMLFFPSLLYSFYRVSLFFSYGYVTSTLAQIVLFLVNIIGPCLCVCAGIAVYYTLCNKSNWGQKLGYVLFGISAILCILSTYSQFYYEGDLLRGTCWIIAVAIGLAGTIKYSNKLLTTDDENEPVNIVTVAQGDVFKPEYTADLEENNSYDYGKIQNETEQIIIEYYANKNNQSVEDYISFLEEEAAQNGFIYSPIDGTKIHALLVFYAKQNNMTYEDYMQPLESKAIG